MTDSALGHSLDTSAISEPGIGRCQTMTPQALVASIRSGERELPASARHARFSLPLRTPFKPDDLVFHPRFGRGRIIEEWGSWLDVDPNGGGLAYSPQLDADAALTRAVNHGERRQIGGLAPRATR